MREHRHRALVAAGARRLAVLARLLARLLAVRGLLAVGALLGVRGLLGGRGLGCLPLVELRGLRRLVLRQGVLAHGRSTSSVTAARCGLSSSERGAGPVRSLPALVPGSGQGGP
ncbi:hypothetical protein GCM10028777_35580 [Angustibacter speluncae]